jgi:nucleoside-diphosphate-sugar epimerase
LPDRWNGRVDQITCDEWSEPALSEALHGYPPSTIFHLAAYGTNPRDRDRDHARVTNVEAPVALVRLCGLHEARLVMAGTWSEYRAPSSMVPLYESAPLETVKIYGASKAKGGVLATDLASALGVGLRILRLFHVYGPGEAPHRLLPSLLAGLGHARRVAMSGGTQVRDFIYVADVVEAFLRAERHIEGDNSPRTWNVCTGIGHSVRDFACGVAGAVGASHDLLGFGDLPLREDDVPWLVGNGELMAAALGWRPQYELASGIEAALSSMTADE